MRTPFLSAASRARPSCDTPRPRRHPFKFGEHVGRIGLRSVGAWRSTVRGPAVQMLTEVPCGGVGGAPAVMGVRVRV